MTIATELTNGGKNILFTVKDEGPGVPDGLQEKIFQPFVKMTDSSVAGVGLGLAISLAVVRSFGGTVGCQNRTDGAKGACFWFEIPYEPMMDGEWQEGQNNVKRMLSAEMEGQNNVKRMLSADMVKEKNENRDELILRNDDDDDDDGDNDARCVHSEGKILHLRMKQVANASSKSGRNVIERRRIGRKAGNDDVQLSAAAMEWFQSQEILIVEDNVVNEKMLRALLRTILLPKKAKEKSIQMEEVEVVRKESKKAFSISILSATNGEEAVEAVVKREGRINVVRIKRAQIVCSKI